jgi:hypothetical protein
MAGGIAPGQAAPGFIAANGRAFTGAEAAIDELLDAAEQLQASLQYEGVL